MDSATPLPEKEKTKKLSGNNLSSETASDLISSVTSLSDSSDCDSLERSMDALCDDDKLCPRDLSDDVFKHSLDDLHGNTTNVQVTSLHAGKDIDFVSKSSTYEDVNEQIKSENLEQDGATIPTTHMHTSRKLPKSKTFDSTMSYFGTLSSDSGCEKRITNSRNHVFMTSQECVVVPGYKLPRETIASRLRFEKQHLSHDKGCGYDDYLTPLQRKDNLIKDLKRQVRELTSCINDKDKEIALYKQNINEETSKLVQGKDDEIKRLREELNKTRQSYEDISSFCEESVSAVSRMEQKAEDLQTEMTDRERQHQRMYLEMYRKGQESARFEREEELERLASSGGCQVTISELVKKLAWTEVELAKWQTIRRQESYHTALRPGTEADTTLKFLRDSFFHYLTDNKESDNHLQAIIKIMNYSEPQMLKIKSSKLVQKLEKKRRSKSYSKEMGALIPFTP